MTRTEKFETMTASEIESRMLHHQMKMIEMKDHGDRQSAITHSRWYRRLDQIHFRRFGVSGDSVLKTPEFAERQGFEYAQLLNVLENHYEQR